MRPREPITRAAAASETVTASARASLEGPAYFLRWSAGPLVPGHLAELLPESITRVRGLDLVLGGEPPATFRHSDDIFPAGLKPCYHGCPLRRGSPTRARHSIDCRKLPTTHHAIVKRLQMFEL